MEFKEKLIEKLINKKAEENNTIDLNAYALGLEDGIKNSKAPELLKQLIELYNAIDSCIDLTPRLLQKTKKLIKEATEL